jgi:replicative DNA helicase
MSARGFDVVTPTDVGAENDVVALLLRGLTTPERLLPLRSKHHYSKTHGQIHEAAEAVSERGEVVELDTVAAELERQGVAGDFRQDLEEIRAYAPLLTARALESHKQRLIELWGRRQLIDVLFRTEAALHVGDIACEGARARLEACLQEIANP